MEVPPEAAPSANAETAPKAETPTVPAAAEAKPQTERGTERRQANVPVEQERRVTERRNPAGIRVDAEGNPTMSPDVQAHWQGSAFGEKPAEDIGAKAREANPEPTRAETKEAPKAAPVNPVAVEEQLNRGLGNEPIKPGVAMRDQGKPAEPVKLSSEPRKAVLQKAGATPEEIEKILPKGAKPGQTGITKVEMSKLAEHFGVDMGASAIGRGKGDLASGTHMTQDAVLQKIIDAGHSPADIAKAIENGKHLSAVSGGSQGADTEPEYTDRGHGLHEVVTGPADNRIGHLLAHDMEGKPDTTQVASHWVDKEERGKGVGTSQLETLAKSLPEGKKTLLSDDEMTDSAKRSWDKFQSQHPEAVKKTAKGYSADLTKFDPNKFRTQTMEKPGAKKSPMKKM
jgi:ribosomal protein S18 acetylase RimI-like enzyme